MAANEGARTGGSARTLRSGGQILIDQLVAQGVERVYCVPGKSYLAALDAMNDAPIEVTVCRQEAGAAMMALTEGRLTGRPGICFVTRGPGATNAAHGVHIAEHDSAPLILFIGQVEREMLGRGAFQEMDYRAFFGSTAKWATQIETAAQIPEIVQRAFHVAMQGRPGPVVDRAARGHADGNGGGADAPRVEPVPIWPGLSQMRELQSCCRRRSGRSRSSAGAGGPSGRAPTSPVSPSASICRSSARSAARAPSTASTTIRRRDRLLDQSEAARAR